MGFHFYEKDRSAAKLPHPKIPLSVFLIVEQGVCATWELMQTRPRAGFNLQTSTEDEVTHELYERLFDEVFDKEVVEGFDKELLTVITRESKLRSYDGSHLDKMPDLLFRLIGRPPVEYPSQDWLFVECKPVDQDHSVGVHYCDKGIIRFVKGEYAWTMTSALMIGYARPGYAISPKLNEALKKFDTSISTTKFSKLCKRSKAGKFHDQVQESEHERKFCYVENGKAAPAILIRHLWLRRN